MVFTHDTEAALEGAAALVNTMPGSVPGDSSPDTLTTLEQLDDLVAAQRWTGRFDRDARELAAVRGLRPRLRGLWELDEEGVVDLVNALLAESRAVPQLVDHDAVGWHIHATPADAPLAQRMAVEAAIAAIDVVRADELRRLRCARPTTATTSSSTSRATGPGASATAAAPREPTPRPTARAPAQAATAT